MNKIAILDLDSILYAAAWGNKIYLGDDEEGNPLYQRDEKGRLIYQDKTEEEISQSVDMIMNDILTQTEATGYIAFVKGKNTGAHRYAAKSDYKANRPKESPSWWKYTKQYVIDAWKAVEVNDIEVDDAVNITRLQIPNSFIVAIDKDLLNLEGTHYNWKKNEWVTVSKEESSLYFWTDMITGQTGDGIKGLPGKGPAFAKKLYLNIEDDEDSLYETCSDCYEDLLGEVEGIKQFVENYSCLKILEEHEGFVIPEITDYKNIINKEIEEILNVWSKGEEKN